MREQLRKGRRVDLEPAMYMTRIEGLKFLSPFIYLGRDWMFMTPTRIYLPL